jgi:hypothetical protein
MFLQSKGKFDEIAELLPQMGVRFLSKTSMSGSVHTQGSYSRLDGRWLAIYVDEGKLMLRCDQEVFPVTATTRSVFRRAEQKHVFRLLDGERLLFCLEYTAPRIDPPLQFDPTAFVEEEDFDFALFLHNVLASPGRRAAFLTANT